MAATLTLGDAQVGLLADNGGPTWTHALLAGSPAIDAGNPAGCTDAFSNLLLTDQRGEPRTLDGNGAVVRGQQCGPHLLVARDCRNLLIEGIVARDPAAALQYGVSEGYGPLREWIAAQMTREGVPAAPERVTPRVLMRHNPCLWYGE